MSLGRRHAIAALATLVFTPAAALAQRRRRQERREERHDDVQDRVAEAMTGWTRLGERWVQPGGVDHDVIVVTAAQGTFRQVALRVEHSALELFDVTITFGDGQTFSPGTRLVFGRDTPSRTIDLPGGNRVIRRVDFRFANLPGGGRAQLELWAR